MKKRLTTKYVENLRPLPDKRLQIWDTLLPGFCIRVGTSGRKSWSVMYRSAAGRQRRLTFGSFPRLSLSEAREIARISLAQADLGQDPQQEKRKQRLERALTLDELADEFIDRYARKHTKHWQGTKRRIQRAFSCQLGQVLITEITKEDIATQLDVMVDRGLGVGVNRSLAAVRKMFNWAVERGYLDIAPTLGLRAPVKESSRDRVLNGSEIQALWHAFETEDWPFGRLFQILLLTGQRRGETAAMCWSHLDLDTNVWTIPKELTKNGRAQLVPLSTTTLRVLAGIPQIEGTDYVFSTNGRTSVSGFGKVKARIEKSCSVKEWRLHDLRRTAASGMAELGIAPHIIEKVLNHSTGQLGGIAGVYNRYQYMEERKMALSKWAQYVEKTIYSADL